MLEPSRSSSPPPEPESVSALSSSIPLTESSATSDSVNAIETDSSVNKGERESAAGEGVSSGDYFKSLESFSDMSIAQNVQGRQQPENFAEKTNVEKTEVPKTALTSPVGRSRRSLNISSPDGSSCPISSSHSTSGSSSSLTSDRSSPLIPNDPLTQSMLAKEARLVQEYAESSSLVNQEELMRKRREEVSVARSIFRGEDVAVQRNQGSSGVMIMVEDSSDKTEEAPKIVELYSSDDEEELNGGEEVGKAIFSVRARQLQSIVFDPAAVFVLSPFPCRFFFSTSYTLLIKQLCTRRPNQFKTCPSDLTYPPVVSTYPPAAKDASLILPSRVRVLLLLVHHCHHRRIVSPP